MGFGALALFLGLGWISGAVDEWKELARRSVRVRAEVVSTRVVKGRHSYIPCVTFRVKGREALREVSLPKAGSVRGDDTEAKEVLARFPVGREVDAWYDVRSSAYGLWLDDPAVPARERSPGAGLASARLFRDGACILGGILIVSGLLVFRFHRRGPSTPPGS